MPGISSYLKALLLALILVGPACDSLEEDTAPASFEGDYGGGTVFYTTPGNKTVINLLDRVPAATTAYNLKITSEPQRGEATIDALGLLLYKQNQPYTEGNDYLSYSISQNGKIVLSETLTIVVSADTATFPCSSGALSDSISLLVNTSHNLLPVLQNDNICSGFNHTLNLIKAPTGDLYWNGSEFVYSATTGFLGEDSFIYQLCQTNSPSATPLCSYGYVSLYIVKEFPCRITAIHDQYDVEFDGSDTLYQLNVLDNDIRCNAADLKPVLEVQRDNIGESNGAITYFVTESTFLESDSLHYKLCQDGSCTSARVLINLKKK